MRNIELHDEYSKHAEEGMYTTGIIDSIYMPELKDAIDIDPYCNSCDHESLIEVCNGISQEYIESMYSHAVAQDPLLVVKDVDDIGLHRYGFHQDMPPPMENLHPKTIKVRTLMSLELGTQYISDEILEYDSSTKHIKPEWSDTLQRWVVGKKINTLRPFEMALFSYTFIHSIPSHRQLMVAGMLGQKRHVYMRDYEIPNE